MFLHKVTGIINFKTAETKHLANSFYRNIYILKRMYI